MGQSRAHSTDVTGAAVVNGPIVVVDDGVTVGVGIGVRVLLVTFDDVTVGVVIGVRVLLVVVLGDDDVELVLVVVAVVVVVVAPVVCVNKDALAEHLCVAQQRVRASSHPTATAATAAAAPSNATHRRTNAALRARFFHSVARAREQMSESHQRPLSTVIQRVVQKPSLVLHAFRLPLQRAVDSSDDEPQNANRKNAQQTLRRKQQPTERTYTYTKSECVGEREDRTRSFDHSIDTCGERPTSTKTMPRTRCKQANEQQHRRTTFECLSNRSPLLCS